MPADAIILEARELTTVLGGKRRFLAKPQPKVRAVDGVSLALRAGEIYGIVGESGCGKTTLARTLLGLQRETAGEILLDGRRVDGLKPVQARRIRRDIQYLQQDAAAALDPWWSVGRSLVEPLRALRMMQGAEARLDATLKAVGLDDSVKKRYPHQLSGGQLRRVALARVLMLQPRIVILDEPTAGLDLSVQASVLRLILDIREKFGVAFLFVSHDLSVVRLICNELAVMYLGRIVEQGRAETIFANPRHPYTRALLAATPKLDGPSAAPAVAGDPPRLTATPAGCPFEPRCAYAIDICAETPPQLQADAEGRSAACHRLDDPALA